MSSILWTLLLPGMVAGLVPWRYFGVNRVQLSANPGHLFALVLIALGAALLASCIWEFATRGRGTLSPFDPTRKLVIRGPYRFVRNPMYLAVVTILLGELVLVESRDLAIYAAAVFLMFNLAVLLYEEPMLRRKFGQEYSDYTSHVGRWLPRLGRK